MARGAGAAPQPGLARPWLARGPPVPVWCRPGAGPRQAMPALGHPLSCLAQPPKQSLARPNQVWRGLQRSLAKPRLGRCATEPLWSTPKKEPTSMSIFFMCSSTPRPASPQPRLAKARGAGAAQQPGFARPWLALGHPVPVWGRPGAGPRQAKPVLGYPLDCLAQAPKQNRARSYQVWRALQRCLAKPWLGRCATEPL